MKFLEISICILLSQAALAEGDHHDHHSHGKSEVKLSLDHGKKWPTDSSLRENMSAIHDQIKDNLGKIHKQELTDSEFQLLGNKIKKNIDSIFANCKLKPEADAQLHIILSGMITANAKLTSKASSAAKSNAVKKILDNYKTYINHFDHSPAKK